ncbi:MAG: hypothetical protein KDA20_09585 [Phycisphaerales bacterium]|nr:hypothetical protein [Phycisphaerales bacterium]
MDLSPLHERILAIVGDRTYRAIGNITDTNSETVRRYLQGQAPSVEFLVALCNRFDVNAHWLITGHGAMKYSETMAEALRSANPAELLSAVADALERLTDRMDRLEVFVQTLDVRVRSVAVSAHHDGGTKNGAASIRTDSAPGGQAPGQAGRPGINGALLPEGGHTAPNSTPATSASAAVGARQRARRIADAVAQRSSEASA